MTPREKLADWITGGKYSHARAEQDRLDNYYAPRMWKYEAALRVIADMQTPNANATVRRMARTAQEAVK